ncbi:hypothetical protein HUJ05_000285 [Dendroctonus ponderosae]|nr:hypothetical protein HUJ05_000285 [Dendroctonus ponderosae]
MPGIWPIKAQGFTKRFYETYFWITFAYYIAFNISGLTMAMLTWSHNYLITANSMAIVIEYVSNAYKVLLLKSQTFKDLLHEIADSERNIFDSNDRDFTDIYAKNTEKNRKIVLFYTIMGTTGISLYFITPLVSNAVTPLGFNNDTGVVNHHFIIFSWFPFDPDRHYSAAYLIQFTGCFFVKRTNNCIKLYTLINFLVSSFQLSLVAYQIFKLPPLQQVTVFSYFITLITQLILNYQAAHAISIEANSSDIRQTSTIKNSTANFQSQNLAGSIFKGDWHSYSPKILRILQLVCMRAQKPLAMTLHSFANVQVNLLIKIFKALYSYICLILKT